MKNLRIRLKILLSFGIVMLMILALAAVVFVNNISANRNTESIRNKILEIGLAADLVENFDDIQLGFVVLSLSFDDEQYRHVTSGIEASRRLVNELRDLIASDGRILEYQHDLDEIERILGVWHSVIGEVNAVNTELAGIISDAYVTQRNLEMLSIGIFDYQIEVSMDEAGQDIDTDARLRRISRIEQGMDIASRLSGIGGSFEVMFKSLDLSNFAEDKAFLEETIVLLTEFRDESTLRYNIDTAASMLNALADYNEDIDNFLAAMTRRNVLIEDGKAIGDEAITVIDKLLLAVEKSASGVADDMISSAVSALRIVAVVVVVVLFISVFLAFYISGLISKPLVVLTEFMKKAGSTGDVTLRPEDVEIIGKLSQIRDEIGQTVGATAAFVSHVNNISEQLNTIAEGNLDTDVELLSEADVMANALKHTVDNLNNLFGEINQASAQVSVGSKQIADGSQSLAQGSTQQAASVEQLSASISEIANKTKTNAEMAGKAAALATTIKDNAEKGSRQMEEMMGAVMEINQAGQSISKVIKVIDDIAFQTNILALNAAVEAARAGQHGKGFAVVAEEVRNLAAKSAEAAKDTSGLIANSIEKAELGSRIAEETSESLAEIVTGINESDRIISEIARSSEEQSNDIAQINTGIDQVAQVVQQNSATAEESAAASQEMSSQSSMLEELISQFRLKENIGISGAVSVVKTPESKVKTFSEYQSNADDYGKY